MDGQDLVSCIICIILVLMAPVKALKSSESCFIPPPTQICSHHRLKCADGEKVRINETFYVKKSETLQCPHLQLNCTSDKYPNCCKLVRGDTNLEFFNITESEIINTVCSDKAYCEFPAPRRPRLIFSVVKYECIRGETTGIIVGVGIAAVVVAISGIIIVILCYLKRRTKQSQQQNGRRLNTALVPLYHEVMDSQPFPGQTACYEYSTIEDIHVGGPDPKPVVGGYDHLGVVPRGIDARGLGIHYDTAACAMPVSQQERADGERARAGSTLYNHLTVKPQKSKVLHNHYDVAMQKPKQ